MAAHISLKDTFEKANVPQKIVSMAEYEAIFKQLAEKKMSADEKESVQVFEKIILPAIVKAQVDKLRPSASTETAGIHVDIDKRISTDENSVSPESVLFVETKLFSRLFSMMAADPSFQKPNKINLALNKSAEITAEAIKICPDHTHALNAKRAQGKMIVSL